MKKPTRLAVLFNGAALMVGLVSAGAMVRHLFIPDEAEPCTKRYVDGTRLSLERDQGGSLTAADLQARFGGTDWGLLDNARVVPVKGGTLGHAIEVRLAKAADETAGSGPRLGMGFTWLPQGFGRAASACLTYSVQLAPDFDFAKGGRLPGLIVAAGSHAAGAATQHFRSGWSESGTLEMRLQLPGTSEARPPLGERSSYELPRGKWVTLEQEVVLNRPGEKNGLVRLWADGALKFEKTGLVLRESADVAILGVMAEAAAVAVGAPDRNNRLWLSAPELHWD